jgi:L-cystine uptake protein TcyP (sodium:dicarboxylate symporter family)
MMRFWIFLALFLGFVVATIISIGNYYFMYFDSFIFLSVGVFPLLFIGIIYGFKEMFLAFSIPFKNENDKNTLAKTYNLFKTYGKITWLVGIILVLIYQMSTLMNLDDPSALGSVLALTLINLLYSAIINGIIIFPYMIILKKKM